MITGSIVLYKNDRLVLAEAIRSFLSSDIVSILYLIDNSPTNDLHDICENEKVLYIHNPTNPGFGAAHNIALRKAMDIDVEFHLILNPDVYYGKDVLENLSEFMRSNPDVGNVMPKVLYPDGTTQFLCKLLPTPYDWIGRRFNPFKEMVEKRNDIFELRFTGYNRQMEVPYLSGCFMYLKIEALRKIGLFDDRIFMYGEETDICRRLIAAGYKTVFNPDVTIYHHFEKGSHKSWRLTKIGIQSAIYYFNKWGWFFDNERRKINRETIKKLHKK